MQLQERLTKTELVSFYRQMLLIRRFEERCAEMYMLGKIRGFLHLYIGEEAIAVGCMSALRPEDYVVTHYRDHGHALARGMDPKVAMAELFGKVTGCSRGKGGSMHFFDASRNFMGGYAIVGGQLPVAVGLALASKMKGEPRVTVCFFGDGALNQGEFHEAFNLASLWKLPVVFFLENNLYGMGSHIDRTYAGGRDVFKAGEHYRIPAAQTDGMDVLAVREATLRAVEHARQGNGPFFLEALTYRFRGHSMADPVEYRDRAEEEAWKVRDPIPTFQRYLLENAIATLTELSEIARQVNDEVEEAIRFADASPEPPPEALYEDIYA
ncbi:MAG: pyruvate dehydrogenase (acetyl-transferring) E1 component subunit alpha [Dehalococcoidia bacterium]|nr:pyruvate dehydrogenase (acetyl-transferring) E1 component subunit alpha [Dehalococcoidia bacterium]MDW8120097.1 pyruvate dehydrogenase (acetyl-transferring) E1 component subunit alpha [Chloroflexota bacterium]